jgi:hypothetical protein
MKFDEAIEAARHGKEIRIGQCQCGYKLDGDRLISVNNRFGYEMPLTLNAALSDKWEIVD